MNTNYQKLTDAVIASIPEGTPPRLLLHSCCGPCSSYVLEYLTRHFEVALLYFNPNIQPQTEFETRLYWQKRLLETMPLPRAVAMLDAEWRGEEFEAAVQGLREQPEGGARCAVCFALRLEETARRAKESGFDMFCTTLTVSPLKSAAVINEIGERLAEKYGVAWLPCDFKKRDGYRRSVELAEKYGLYRQDYCGCLYGKT